MNKMLPLLLVCLSLTGCMLRTHKADVVQGNVITDSQVKQLHNGMSMASVREIMGSPVLVNVFTPNKTVYLYTFQEGYGYMKKRSVTLTFQGGQVVDIQTTEYV
jgi:outer membrane protein assembly factor BamE